MLNPNFHSTISQFIDMTNRLKKLFNRKSSNAGPLKFKPEVVRLGLDGMTCEDCAPKIERLFDGNKHIIYSKVSYEKKVGQFTFDSNELSKNDIISTINKSKKYSVKDSNSKNDGDHNYDLIIIGGGSAAFAALITAHEAGLSILLINGGLPLGGTCVNVGCVPSKYLIRAAEQIYKSSHSPFSGVGSTKPQVNYSKIIKEKRELVSKMQQKKYIDIITGFENLTVIEGFAKFIDNKTIQVDENEKYTGSRFIIATGSSAEIPSIDGLDKVKYFTNETLFELEELPESLTIIGGGYIGLEIAQAYQRFGSQVSIVEYTDEILSNEQIDISEEVSQQFKSEGINIYTAAQVENIVSQEGFIVLHGIQNGKSFEIKSTDLLIAAGRKANSNELGLENTNIKILESGHIQVDDYLQTAEDNIYAIGDVNTNPPFVYTAAYEGKTAVINAFENERKKADYNSMPWVIFTDPQIAGVGIDEKEAEINGIPYEVTKLPLTEVSRSLAALDTRGFIKLIRDPESDKLLGARIVAPEGGELIMELSLAIKYGITVKQLVESFHPYLTLSEGIKLAALSFDKEVAALSCCAV